MEAFIGVVLGGAISLVTTLTVDLVRWRRERDRRWDGDALDAIEQFIEMSNRAIGALVDEGRARTSGDAERTHELDRAARAAIDSVRVARARARLLLPDAVPQIEAYWRSLRELKELADAGFPDGDPQWKEIQSDLEKHFEDVMRVATQRLAIASQKQGLWTFRPRRTAVIPAS